MRQAQLGIRLCKDCKQPLSKKQHQHDPRSRGIDCITIRIPGTGRYIVPVKEAEAQIKQLGAVNMLVRWLRWCYLSPDDYFRLVAPDAVPVSAVGPEPVGPFIHEFRPGIDSIDPDNPIQPTQKLTPDAPSTERETESDTTGS
jgi:hypothetical protein